MAEEIVRIGDTSGDEILDVTFYKKMVDENEVDFINIKVPGDKSVEIDLPVNDDYKRRFARKWDAYQAMDVTDGTSIDDWIDIPEGLKREFKYLGFRFIEQVAGAPDSAFTRIMGGTQWRLKAQAYLNKSKVNDDIVRKQQEQIEELKAQMAQMAELVQEKRGRKPKEVVESA